MAKFVCDVCGYIGTKFEDLPDDFECPMCSVGKDQFSPAEDE